MACGCGGSKKVNNEVRDFDVTIERAETKHYRVAATSAREANKKVREMIIEGPKTPVLYNEFPSLVNQKEGVWYVNSLDTRETLKK